MSRLPANALRFLLLIYGVGLACVLTVCLFPVFHAPLVPWEMALFSLLAVLAGGKKVLVIPNKTPENGVALSWDFALTVAATLRFGPAAGVLMACIGSLASCLYPRRQPVYQIAFNLALAATETWAAGLVFLWLNGDTLTLRPVHTIPAMLAFCFISYLINSGGVAGIVALCTGQKAGELWRETFLWGVPEQPRRRVGEHAGVLGIPRGFRPRPAPDRSCHLSHLPVVHGLHGAHARTRALCRREAEAY